MTDVDICSKHHLRLPCPDCGPRTAQMIAEGYDVERDPTPAMRAAYAARVGPDETPRPKWRFNEHWALAPDALVPVDPDSPPLTRKEIRE